MCYLTRCAFEQGQYISPSWLQINKQVKDSRVVCQESKASTEKVREQLSQGDMRTREG